MTNTSRRRVVYHEAAHAVVARHLGLPVGRVCVDGEHGWTETKTTGVDPEQLLLVDLAGMAGELRLTGTVDLGSARCDLERAFRRADEIKKPNLLGEAEDLLRASLPRARTMVDELWSEIKELADSLSKAPDGCVDARTVQNRRR